MFGDQPPRPVFLKVTATNYICNTTQLGLVDNQDGTFTFNYLDGQGTPASAVLTISLATLRAALKIIDLV